MFYKGFDNKAGFLNRLAPTGLFFFVNETFKFYLKL